jgi:hypothetical protein
MKEFICHPAYFYNRIFFHHPYRTYTDAPLLTFDKHFFQTHDSGLFKKMIKPIEPVQYLDTFPALITEHHSNEQLLSIAQHYMKEKQGMIYVNNYPGFHFSQHELHQLFSYAIQNETSYRFSLLDFNWQENSSSFDKNENHYPHHLTLKHESIDLLNPLFQPDHDVIFEQLFGKPGKIIWAIGIDCRANHWVMDSDNLTTILDYDNLVQWFRDKTWSLMVSDIIEDYLDYLEDNHLTHQQVCEKAEKLIAILKFYEQCGVLNKFPSCSIEETVCSNHYLYVSLPHHEENPELENNTTWETKGWDIHHLFYLNLLAISKKYPEKTSNIIHTQFYQPDDETSKWVREYLFSQLDGANRWIFHYYKSLFLEKKAKAILPFMNSLCLAPFTLDFIQQDVEQWVRHHYSLKEQDFGALPSFWHNAALYFSTQWKKEELSEQSHSDTQYNLRDYGRKFKPVIKKQNENSLFYISPKYKSESFSYLNSYPLSHTLKMTD